MEQDDLVLLPVIRVNPYVIDILFVTDNDRLEQELVIDFFRIDRIGISDGHKIFREYLTALVNFAPKYGCGKETLGKWRLKHQSQADE